MRRTDFFPKRVSSCYWIHQQGDHCVESATTKLISESYFCPIYYLLRKRRKEKKSLAHWNEKLCLQLSPKNIGNEAKKGDYFSSDGQNSFGRWLTTNDYVPIFRKWPIEYYKQEITSSNLIWLNTLVALLVSNRVVSPCYTITTPFATLLQIVEK